MTVWQTILAWLAALSADPAEIDREPPRAAAAVAAAYAGFLPDAQPAPPAPAPAKECPCGGSCKGTGIYRPDGRIEMRCEPGCKACGMRSVLAAPCPDGKCQKPISPAPSR